MLLPNLDWNSSKPIALQLQEQLRERLVGPQLAGSVMVLGGVAFLSARGRPTTGKAEMIPGTLTPSD